MLRMASLAMWLETTVVANCMCMVVASLLVCVSLSCVCLVVDLRGSTPLYFCLGVGVVVVVGLGAWLVCISSQYHYGLVQLEGTFEIVIRRREHLY